MKQLTKSYDRRLMGVCGGIAHYMDPSLDPVFIRIGWFALSIMNPLMVVLYFVLAVFLPEPQYL